MCGHNSVVEYLLAMQVAVGSNPTVRLQRKRWRGQLQLSDNDIIVTLRNHKGERRQVSVRRRTTRDSLKSLPDVLILCTAHRSLPLVL